MVADLDLLNAIYSIGHVVWGVLFAWLFTWLWNNHKKIKRMEFAIDDFRIELDCIIFDAMENGVDEETLLHIKVLAFRKLGNVK